MIDFIDKRPITHEYLLTPKALKLVQGKMVINATTEDWQSFHAYFDRVRLVDSITENVFKHFNLPL